MLRLLRHRHPGLWSSLHPLRRRRLDDRVSANGSANLKPVSNYQDLLNQLITQLRASLATRGTQEQIREAAETLIVLGERVVAATLRSVGIVVLGSSQALANADANLLNTIVQQARAAQIQESIRRTWGPH